jgi:succinate dehydrogenase/fumarate reductase flavoprotein subunit
MKTSPWIARDAAAARALLAEEGAPSANPAALVTSLQEIMSRDVGPFRTAAGLERALAEIARLRDAMGPRPPGPARAFDAARLDWFDLRNMLLVAETVARAALARTESRGAHQREDFPAQADAWARHQTVHLADGALALGRTPVERLAEAVS